MRHKKEVEEDKQGLLGCCVRLQWLSIRLCSDEEIFIFLKSGINMNQDLLSTLFFALIQCLISV